MNSSNNSNNTEKYGCILHSIDIAQVESNITHETTRNLQFNTRKEIRKKHIKQVKPIDFFLQNEINVVAALRFNASVQTSVNVDFHSDNSSHSHKNVPIKSFVGYTPVKAQSQRESQQRYGMFYYNEDHERMKGLIPSLIDISNMQLFNLTLISAYISALNALMYLKQNEIVHMGLTIHSLFMSPQNTIYIGDMHYSHSLRELKNTRSATPILKTILCNERNIFAPNFVSVELLLLAYIVKHDITALSGYNIQVVLHTYINENLVLRRMPTRFREDYKNQCEITLAKYINMPQQFAIENILKDWNTWATCSLSMIYLNIFMVIQAECRDLCKQGIYNKWFKLMLMNTHPDPKKRKTLEETMGIFTKMIYANPLSDFAPMFTGCSSENIANICLQLQRFVN